MARVNYVLWLYVAGITPRSQNAIAIVTGTCGKYLLGRYELEVIDMRLQPAHAASDQVLAAPTLIRKLPLPPLHLIGDMTDEDKLLSALGLRYRHENEKK